LHEIAMTAGRQIRRLLTPPLVLLAVLVLLFEATFWRWMVALGHYLARRLPFFDLAEALVERMSPRLVGLVFAVPLAVLVPIKLAAVWLIVRGHLILGIIVIIAAKTVATAISARLFVLAKPKLMQLPSFAWAYGHVTRWIEFAHEYVDSLPAWRRTREVFTALRRQFAQTGSSVLRRLWKASMRRAARIRTPI
jgi:hypothetical protein